MDRFERTRSLGAGGMGEVFLAKDRTTGGEVVVKVLREDVPPQALARFEREFQVLAGLEHPAIVPVLEWGRMPTGEPFYTMPFVADAVNLEAWAARALAPGPPAPQSEVVRALAPVAAALDHLHAKGLRHRDVKPSNILVLPDGEGLLIDFGLVGLVQSELTRTGMVLGTMQYLSPEQARGEDAGPASDVYQLGLVVYELATGQRACADAYTWVDEFKHGRRPFANPSAREPRVGAGLEEALLRATDLDPARRFASASELVAALRAVPPEKWRGARTTRRTRPVAAVPPPAPAPAQAARRDRAGPGGGARAVRRGRPLAAHPVPRRARRAAEGPAGPHRGGDPGHVPLRVAAARRVERGRRGDRARGRLPGDRPPRGPPPAARARRRVPVHRVLRRPRAGPRQPHGGGAVRLQDKLITLHQKTPHAGLRRYLVREMERVVPADDSGRILDLVTSAARSNDAGEAFQARRTLLCFAPRHVEARFGPGERMRSVVTGSKEAEEAAAPFGEVPLRVISLVARPAIERVIAKLPQMAPPLAARAAAALARFVDADVEPALDRLLAQGSAGPVAACVLARRLSARDPDRALELIAPLAGEAPELAVALAQLDRPDRIVPVLDRAYGTAAGSVPAAIALEGLSPAARRPLVERMLGAPRGWSLVHALASLARGGAADEVGLVSGVLCRFEQPLVRAEAARCLGRIAHPAAREACRALIAASPDAPEATAALDGLLRQAIPDAERMALFGPALASRDPEALAFACLGLAGVDPERAASGVRELLTGSTEARVHGAHLLAYLPGAPTIRLLSKLVTRDPEAAVRRQAAVSLTYQPASPALAGALMTLIGQVEPALQPTLAPALVRARETADPAVLDLLAITQKACPPGTREPILEAIGAVDLPEARKHIEAELAGRPDPDVLFGALGACGTSALLWPRNPGE